MRLGGVEHSYRNSRLCNTTPYRIKAHQNMEEDPYGGSTEEEDNDKEGVNNRILYTTWVHLQAFSSANQVFTFIA